MNIAIPPPSLFAPLTLPNKAVISNRIAKAAMEENMADSGHFPAKACGGCMRTGPMAVPD